MSQVPKTYADLTDAEIHEMSVGDRVERARLQRMRLNADIWIEQIGGESAGKTMRERVHLPSTPWEFDEQPKVPVRYREGGFNTTRQMVLPATEKSLADMTMDEYAQSRARAAIQGELLAQARRSSGLFDRVVTDTSHSYHPENPFNLWRAARARFIETGSADDFDKMMAAVRSEDADEYDKEADREEDTTVPAEPVRTRRGRARAGRAGR